MKLFPHILSRVGGFLFKELEVFSFSKMDFVNVLLVNEENLEFQFQKVLETFKSTFDQSNDFQHKAILKNAKIDFKNHRTSFLKKIKKINEPFTDELKNEAAKYSRLLDENKQLQNEFEQVYKNEELEKILELKKLTTAPSFRKGIIQSSQSLFGRIDSFERKDPVSYRKKERQIVRALSQYIYRMGTKTSPFSSFTTLDLLSQENGIFQSETATDSFSLIQYNNFIFSEMKSLLLKNPSFYRQLKLKNNPSVILQNEEYIFLKNHRNIETVQRVEVSQILLVLSRNIIPKEGLLFDKVIYELSKIVEAERVELEAYLLEIIDTRLIEWDWEISGLSLNWEESFYDFVKSKKEFQGKIKWTHSLEKMIEIKSRYKNADAKTRKFLQLSIKGDLERLGFEKVFPELIFFEDVRKSSEIKISEDEIYPIINSLDNLLRLLEPFVVDEFKSRIHSFWENNFKKDDSISLINFYENFYNTEPHNNTFTRNEKLRLLKNEIKRIGQIDEFGNLYFSTQELLKIFPEREYKSSTQYSGLFQLYENEGKMNAVINGLTPGFGKLFGRFLPLFEDDITIQLQNWNSDLQKDNLWVENVDASVFNANQYPSFLNFEITNAGSENKFPEEKQISIKDIEVVWNNKSERPELIHSKTKKTISVFDFGFEHPSNRSPMFQLLNGFSLNHSTYRMFLEIVNELFFTEKASNNVAFRRIILDDHLVLQRQFQEVSNSFFPKKEKGESNASYFVKIQKWRIEEKLPQYIFVKPIPNSSSNGNKDLYKPQFIDLESPFGIVLLQKILEKHLGQFIVEEMLPGGENLINDSVAEFAIQWKN